MKMHDTLQEAVDAVVKKHGVDEEEAKKLLGIRHKVLTKDINEYQRKHYALNIERERARSKTWRENNVEFNRSRIRKYSYFKNYGITIEEAEQMLKDQNNKCVICSKEISFGSVTGAHIDHNHETNQVRGILCSNCNKVLGHAKDNINTLLNAINYLKKRKFILIVSPFEKTAS